MDVEAVPPGGNVCVLRGSAGLNMYPSVRRDARPPTEKMKPGLAYA